MIPFSPKAASTSRVSLSVSMCCMMVFFTISLIGLGMYSSTHLNKKHWLLLSSLLFSARLRIVFNILGWVSWSTFALICSDSWSMMGLCPLFDCVMRVSSSGLLKRGWANAMIQFNIRGLSVIALIMVWSDSW